MSSHETLRKIEELADARDARAALTAAYDERKADILRQVAHELEALDAEYAPLLEAANRHIQVLEQEVREAIIQYGASVRGSRIQAVYVKGRTTWDAKGLTRYAASHPEILAYRKESAPTVQLRTIKERRTSTTEADAPDPDAFPF